MLTLIGVIASYYWWSQKIWYCLHGHISPFLLSRPSPSHSETAARSSACYSSSSSWASSSSLPSATLPRRSFLIGHPDFHFLLVSPLILPHLLAGRGGDPVHQHPGVDVVGPHHHDHRRLRRHVAHQRARTVSGWVLELCQFLKIRN